MNALNKFQKNSEIAKFLLTTNFTRKQVVKAIIDAITIDVILVFFMCVYEFSSFSALS